MPKPPPTSPTKTRILSSLKPGNDAASVVRTPEGIWLAMRSVTRPLAESGAALIARGSKGLGARRWLSMSRLTQCAALANTAATLAASPWRIAAAMLSGALSHSTGAPGRIAANGSTTAGNSSQSTITASAAARAWASDSATTMAMASPT